MSIITPMEECDVQIMDKFVCCDITTLIKEALIGFSF